MHAPIIEQIYSLYVSFHKVLLAFPKYERGTLGLKIQEILLQFTEIIFLCTSSKSMLKREHLQAASAKLDLVKLLIRLAYDVKATDYKRYLTLQENLQTIGKMLGGWIKTLG